MYSEEQERESDAAFAAFTAAMTEVVPDAPRKPFVQRSKRPQPVAKPINSLEDLLCYWQVWVFLILPALAFATAYAIWGP